ncbi:hypothetical protein SAMN05216466_12133 [Paraburkholderia phenazinium]|uniref:Uncharacterized protein n=1 Tax=Paraburkholderia phenazinium TaxID=60549 RepID=A0A1G8JSV3_9BURK|nr:hypothetical protein SAMN05216466_12133 [Paraburkholderia phenazinium]
MVDPARMVTHGVSPNGCIQIGWYICDPGTGNIERVKHQAVQRGSDGHSDGFLYQLSYQ